MEKPDTIAPTGSNAEAGLEIRTMRPDDVNAVCLIDQSGGGFPWTRAMFLEEGRKDHSRMWVAVDRTEGTILGYVCFWMLAGEIQILNLAVHPGHRRKGIGRRLVGEVLRYGRDRDSDAAGLEVRSSNAAARALYEKMGFVAAGLRRSYYRNPVDNAVLMERIESSSGFRPGGSR